MPDRTNLPHSAIKHRITVQYHPETNLWTPSQGLAMELDVYGWYGRRNGQIGWQTDLVQPSEPEVELSDAMTGKEMKSLCDALIYNLQWQTQHVRPQSRRGDIRGSGEVEPGHLLIRRILPDVISKGTMT